MRRTLVTIHLWLGLIVGLFWAIQGLTGAALMFHREMDRWSIPAPAPGPMASIDRIVEVAKARTGAEVISVGIADARADLLNVQYRSGGPRQLQLDASTARAVRDRSNDPTTPLSGSPWRWVYLVHETLLLHDKGETLIGVSGVLLFSTLILGLWIGWPRLRHWRQALRWTRWRSTRAKLFGWHRLAGIAAGALLVMTVPGGIWTTFAADLRPALAVATDFQMPYKPQPVDALGTVIDPQQALDAARTVFPQATFVRISMPTPKAPAYVVRFRQPDELRWSGVTTVTIDAATGRTLAVYDPAKAPLANRITDAAFPLHTGEIAGLGGRIAVMLAGLSLPALFVTGVWSWLRRKRRRAAAR